MSHSRPAEFQLEIGNRRWLVAPEPAFDLSIPLTFDGMQPTFFGAPAASSSPLTAGTFVGDIRRGGSCNCSSYALTPHCSGTHTECVGHITAERVSVRDLALAPLYAAALLSVTPADPSGTHERSDPPPQPGDRLVTRAALIGASQGYDLNACNALVVRTLPNTQDKPYRNYDDAAAPYLSIEAIQWIVQLGIDHLIVDLPSIDRGSDEGRLTAHRHFWGIPAGDTRLAAAKRPHATVTELAYVSDAVADGYYVLSLQVAPFAADAAPSRPILYRRTLA